jgi:hypothetical protein
MKGTYKLRDAVEAAIGAFSAVLLFFALRTEPMVLDPQIGFMITFFWVLTFFYGDKYPKFNFLMTMIITAVVSGLMTIVFGLSTQEQLLSFDYFGSAAIIGFWLGFPIALLMDKFNMANLLSRYYVRAK